MSLDRLVRARRPAWNRLREIVDMVSRRGAGRAGSEQVHELAFLYREVSADLARLQVLDADPSLLREINGLVSRAHGQIYRDTSERSYRILPFFLEQVPRLFRESWAFMLASLLVSVCFYAMAYATVQTHPDLVADILGCCDPEFRGPKSAGDIRERFQLVPSPVLSSAVTTNNIIVAFQACAFGVTFGIGTLYVLVVNATMLGGIAGAFGNSGIESVFWTTVWPHGALELSAIVVAGGAGLRLGYSLWCPGARTRRRALREESVEAAKLAIGLIPAFVVAGFFEGFITPNAQLLDAVKVGLGSLAAIAFWLYLLAAGRHRTLSV
jgi:uncharacterized membrane protein SpoIIM required for sporulation